MYSEEIAKLLELRYNLIESDADYIKFPDGTMICYGSNTSVDGSYRSITFPEEFARTPILLQQFQELLQVIS